MHTTKPRTRRRVSYLTGAIILGSMLFAMLANAGGATTVSFEQDIQPVFNQSCYTCHVTGAEPAGLALDPGRAYEELVGVESTQSPLLLVEPGEPENSYLLHKLRGTHLDVGGQGTQMPQGAGSLADEVIELIAQWIEEGAPDN